MSDILPKYPIQSFLKNRSAEMFVRAIAQVRRLNVGIDNQFHHPITITGDSVLYALVQTRMILLKNFQVMRECLHPIHNCPYYIITADLIPSFALLFLVHRSQKLRLPAKHKFGKIYKPRLKSYEPDCEGKCIFKLTSQRFAGIS